MQPIHNWNEGALQLPAKADLLRQFEPNHQPKPATDRPHFGLLRQQQSGSEKFTDTSGVVRKTVALDDFQDFQSHRTAERRATEGAGMGAGTEHVRQFYAMRFFANPKGAHGKAAAEGFCHRNAIG